MEARGARSLAEMTPPPAAKTQSSARHAARHPGSPGPARANAQNQRIQRNHLHKLEEEQPRARTQTSKFSQ